MIKGATAKKAKTKTITAGPTPFVIGKSYFIRTVTYHLVGTVTSCVGQFILLKDAAWVADSGRFTQALRDGTLNEVEPIPDGEAIVNLGAVTDAFIWAHTLPLTQK